jgi:hypothetical protein
LAGNYEAGSEGRSGESIIVITATYDAFSLSPVNLQYKNRNFHMELTVMVVD